MKQTMLLQLAPTTEQHQAMLETMHAFNAAFTHAEVAFREHSANKFELQKPVYGGLHSSYQLPAQLAIRAISKASEAYKRDKSIQPTFRTEGVIVYDPGVMSFKGLSLVSLLTLSKRVLVSFRSGGYQEVRLDRIKGQADLLYRDGTFYLAVTLDAPEPAPDETSGTLGIDLGLVNLACASTGETFRGQAVEKTRQRMHALHPRLQKRGTKSAKRHLKRLSGKESRLRTQVNHLISKQIVQKAKATGKARAIEIVRHIRQRTEARLKKSQRARHCSWAFGQLRSFLPYKAALAGVPLHTVDPRNTSKTCHACGSTVPKRTARANLLLCASSAGS